MKSKQSGVKFSIVLFSVIFLGVSAWFTKAQAYELPEPLVTEYVTIA
ncbi:hypothetical protein PSECIP111951_02940 [Pseudoalteromonas holothuriae]|uniref:Uncharacterized protein n=1 Tax=Pseudoalteromonas holothuriae TaxID=2963714 RepID=A0ABM9GKL5_9GAMM|nr:hypothetical protein [Pseudoalteromonas sp. CIP111951]CAH9063627.1 hypothetical protein PSECIP111951_02940 [Pseudoalteromonas sp. CIP111951]